MTKIYNCYICKRQLDYRRYRINHQTFTKGPYSKSINKGHYDLCLPCYKKYLKYIKEMKEIFKDC